MPSIPRLPKHLRAVLGEDAGGELVTIIDEMRTERRQSEALLREQLARLDQHFEQLETRMVALEVKLGDVKADLMKWSFVFWVGAVTAIAALAGVLR